MSLLSTLSNTRTLIHSCNCRFWHIPSKLNEEAIRLSEIGAVSTLSSNSNQAKTNQHFTTVRWTKKPYSSTWMMQQITYMLQSCVNTWTKLGAARPIVEPKICTRNEYISTDHVQLDIWVAMQRRGKFFSRRIEPSCSVVFALLPYACLLRQILS